MEDDGDTGSTGIHALFMDVPVLFPGAGTNWHSISRALPLPGAIYHREMNSWISHSLERTSRGNSSN